MRRYGLLGAFVRLRLDCDRVGTAMLRYVLIACLGSVVAATSQSSPLVEATIITL